MLLKMLSLGPFAVNCFIVGCETTKEAMIIDPGDQAQIILNTVKDLGLTAKLIVNTHAHMDHVMALAEVKKATGAPFLLHKDEVPMLRQGPGRSLLMMGLRMPKIPEPDQLLQEGDVVRVGDLSFAVLHTPGHTPGGISLYGEGVVFTGDTLFNFGIGRTDFNPDPERSHKQLIHSIKTKLMVLPDETKVYPGHGPETTIRVEREFNPFLS